ncbi:paired immunoglobulin-like type 2 receptor alpha isoform X2 [Rhinolophus sinicus]|uniref:paired immunoglobulin-like type 2 receptor alpha isoform X2 n=1 Tax=Rhinolophus sinicus TaxID=89399 RepID=UPI003D796EC1
MGLPLLRPLLLLLLLLLLMSLQAGRSTKCSSKLDYEVYQPGQLSAPEGGSVHIPFSFCHPWELPSVLSDFKDRLSLNWTKDWSNGSLQISNLRREDKSSYFCRVHLTLQNHDKINWQSIPGTNLTITPAPKKTTQGPTSTAAPSTATPSTAATTDGLSTTADKSSGPLTLGAIVGVALAGAVFIIAILGVTVYLRWKRSKGLRTNARAPARGSFQNTEENYENTGNKGRHREPELDTKDDNILYASLALSSLNSRSAPPCQPPQENPQEETLYSTVKT